MRSRRSFNYFRHTRLRHANGAQPGGVLSVTSIANLVIWTSLYERQRRIIFGASMMAVHGRVQREDEVVYLVANQLTDMSAERADVGERDQSFPLPHGRGDEFHHGGSPDTRGLPPKALRTRDIYNPDLHIDSIKVKTRDFR